MLIQNRISALLPAVLFLLCAPFAASAQTFVNAGANAGPKEISSGQSVGFEIYIQSPQAVSNAVVALQVRPYTAQGGISSTVVHTQTFTGQNFSAGETKKITGSFPTRDTLATGDYTWTIKATNSTGTLVYMDIAKTVSNYTFHVTGRYRRGINIMDLGNAGHVLPGRYGSDYSKPSLASLQYLKSRGHDVVRIPFMWERIQPIRRQALNTAYRDLLLQTLKDANTAGLKVIVDMHNYGRYTENGVTHTFGGNVSEDDYKDAWSRIATAIKGNAQAYSAVYAYDIMNEPHDLPYYEGSWTQGISVASFESSTEGWVTNPEFTTLSKEVRANNQGSLKLTTRAINLTNGLVFGASLPPSMKRTALGDGRTFQAQVFVPTTTPGSVRARLVMADGSARVQYGDDFPLTKGVVQRVYFTPPEGAWANNQGIGIDFIVDGTTSGATHVFYVDQWNQGTQSGELKPPRQWERYSQAAVAAIRATNDNTLIMVEGYSHASAERWPENHPKKWINDSNIMYHAHIYLDGPGGGSYQDSHDKLLADAKGKGYASVGAHSIARVKNFTNWVAAQGTQGFVGEYGWPNSAIRPNEYAAYDKDGEEFLTFLDSVGMGATMWTTGSWEKRPNINILAAYEVEPSFTALSPALVIERHRGNP
ncbi:cellulase family glycosylhydrolase [Cystobacter fuscus]